MRELEEELEALRAAGLFRQLRLVQGKAGDRLLYQGRELVNLSSNNYLGLSFHPQVVEAGRQLLEEYGWSACASRLISGHTPRHQALEEQLARFLSLPAALIFSSGYLANLGTISALVGQRDIIFSDQLNHASIIDGCRLSKARVEIYPHGDLDALKELLKKSSSYRRRMIVTETLFSMEGDLAPLKELVVLAQEHEAWLMVDEAHALGVLGPAGRGLVHAYGLASQVPIVMGTFGKALGCFGAFVAGQEELIRYLVNRCRTFIYTTALPPAVCGAVSKALELVEAGDSLRQRLWQNIQYFRQGLISLGFNTLESPAQIIPVVIGSAEMTLRASEILLKEGVYSPAIRPPTVPQGAGRLRCCLSAVHTGEELELALEAFKEMGTQLRLI